MLSRMKSGNHSESDQRMDATQVNNITNIIKPNNAKGAFFIVPHHEKWPYQNGYFTDSNDHWCNNLARSGDMINVVFFF